MVRIFLMMMSLIASSGQPRPSRPLRASTGKRGSHLSGRVEVSEVDDTQPAEMLRGLVNQVTYGLQLGGSETANEALDPAQR